MIKNWTRRSILKGTAAGMMAANLPMPFISRAMAASGKIVVGMEAGSPYDTFYKKHPRIDRSFGVTVEFISIPNDNPQQLGSMPCRRGGFDVIR